jgi:hypothetical protein
VKEIHAKDLQVMGKMKFVMRWCCLQERVMVLGFAQVWVRMKINKIYKNYVFAFLGFYLID